MPNLWKRMCARTHKQSSKKGTRMSKWKITRETKSDHIPDAIMEIITLGAVERPSDYEVTNKETGEVKHYTAYNEKQVGEAIRNGKLHN